MENKLMKLYFDAIMVIAVIVALVATVSLYAQTQCARFNASRYILTYDGIYCGSVVYGSEYMAPLDELKNSSDSVPNDQIFEQQDL